MDHRGLGTPGRKRVVCVQHRPKFRLTTQGVILLRDFSNCASSLAACKESSQPLFEIRIHLVFRVTGHTEVDSFSDRRM